MSVAWTPVEVDLGCLPSTHEEVKVYNLTDPQIPPNAKEVLIYTFITSIGEGEFQRGWYQISTSDGNKESKQYMNVATGKGVNIVNSANLWFPMTADKSLTVKLNHPGLERSQNKHIAGSLAASHDWSKVFVIGYRS